MWFGIRNVYPILVAKYKERIYYYHLTEDAGERLALTVKMDKKRKEDVERFVASLVLERGIKITLQEALGLMVDYSLDNKDEFLKRVRRLPPLEDDPAWKKLKKPDDWKVKDASEKVDEYLYGGS